MPKILVTGMSGTGKSSAIAALGRLSYRVVDTDDPGWSEWTGSPDFLGSGEQLWVEDRIDALLASSDDETLFISGCARNQVKFYPRFDSVALLSAPAEVILERIAKRTTNPYGKTPEQRDLILHHLATVEPALRAACTHEVDAARPLEDVVADLIAISEAQRKD